jgi:hypothetical protein
MERKRQAMVYTIEVLKPLLAPDSDLTIDHITEYIALEGPFQNSRPFMGGNVNLVSFWKVSHHSCFTTQIPFHSLSTQIYEDSPLAIVALPITKLPSSTGSIERVWSQSGQCLEGRERLSSENLEVEVFSRWNLPLLD